MSNNLILKPASNRVSNFTFKKVSDDDDLFLCAKRNESNGVYTSNRISYIDIIGSYIEYLKEMTNKQGFFLDRDSNYFNPSGCWNFTSNDGGIHFPNNIELSDFLSSSVDNDKFPGYVNYDFDETTDEDGNTKYDKVKYLAVNHKFVKNQLLSELNDLSAHLYGESNRTQILPSYVGMVIMNDSLSTLTSVKNIYGSGTDWKQIEGRYILGAGNVAKSNNLDIDIYGKCASGSFKTNVNDMGGQNEISSSELDLAKHSHKFNAGKKSKGEIPNFGKLPRYFVSSTEVQKTTADTHKVYYPDPVDGTTVKTGLETYAQSKIYAMNSKTLNLEIQTYGSSYGTPKGKFTAELEIDDFVIPTNNGESQPHSNMHPYYATYIWVRTE